MRICSRIIVSDCERGEVQRDITYKNGSGSTVHSPKNAQKRANGRRLNADGEIDRKIDG